MSVVSQCLVETKSAEAAQTTQFTVPVNSRVILDKMTVTNVTGTAAVISVNLVVNGSTAGASNVVISVKSVAANDSYTCPELVNHTLNAGDFVSTLAGTAAALNIRISGRVVA